MKVAYLLGSLGRGGTETLVLDVLRRADYATFEMIAVHRRGGAYEQDFGATGVPVYKCEMKQGRVGYMWRVVDYLRRLRRILRQEQVTHAHAQQSIDCLYARLATIGTGIRVVETFHGFDYEAGRMGRLINRLSIRWADKVLFVSEYQKEYYLKRYVLRDGDKYKVVYNGVDFKKLDVEYEEPDFLREIDSATAENGKPAGEVSSSVFAGVSSSSSSDVGVPSSAGEVAKGKRRIRMAMVGNFVSGRSQSYPCMSIGLLNERGIADFDFYFIGKRNEAEPWRYDDCVRYCEEHGLKNVHFMGGRRDVPAVLQHIDAFVYSTDHDTFGIAVVEAMAAGVPVLVNDWAVMREVLQKAGYEESDLWKSGDAESLAERMTMFMRYPERYASVAEKIKIHAREVFSIERHISSLAEVYMGI